MFTSWFCLEFCAARRYSARKKQCVPGTHFPFRMGLALLGGFIETVGRKVCLPGHFSADLDGSVFRDGNSITGFDRLEELVPEQVDGDDAAVIPDIIHQQPGI